MAMMDTMLNMNGNKSDESSGFMSNNAPKKNPYEMDIGGEKENLNWLLG